ncbi:MAG: hypothetical protein EZS28_016189 [Streblomastix strix]|uniref:Protein kinase domain-containing protein n=1 Tax=Streblomastix strix TaxID=222440 RepID=A0A5J4W024_9EUKA|nr:MAG: hypothetical protein EZS28_016189 [Streblomastix strix]
MRIDEERVWKLIKQIAFALNTIHTLQIEHEFLTPENIMLTKDVSIKLSKYGMPRIQPEEEANLTAIDNSQIYKAPELQQEIQPENSDNDDVVIIIDPDLAYTSAVDIWSFGLIIFETLSWFHPFSCEGV